MKQAQKNFNKWAKELGLSEKAIFGLDGNIVQAQRIAQNLIKNYARLMLVRDIEIINNYLNTVSAPCKRKTITKNACYEVMNINKTINRKLYKEQKTQRQATKRK